MIKVKLKVGVSDCLLGSNVRYDGGHKKNDFITNILAPFAEFKAFCPEAECGLSIPREAMHLEGTQKSHRLVTLRTKIDHTDKMNLWIKKTLKSIEKENLVGFIFKSKSPSSGMQNIKIYDEKNNIVGKTAGLFAAAFMSTFPLIPVEDEGRLNDEELRESFIERVFVYNRWQTLFKSKPKLSDLIKFHQQHKLLIMSHDLKKYRELGNLIASAKDFKLSDLSKSYIALLMDTLKIKSTVRKKVNVLQHMSGYFKKWLEKDDKLELQKLISDYHHELVPIIVPISLINHYVRKFNVEYLNDQYFLQPHPIELKLRNHV